MPQTTRARVIVVDPSLVFHEGIRDWLTEGGHEVLAQAQNLDATVQQLEALQPDLVIVGPDLAEHESLAVCREIVCRWPGIKTLVITPHTGDSLFLVDAMFAGASTCLPRRVTRDEFLDTIASVMVGHQLFPREILSQTFHPIALTARQREVLELMAGEKTAREIAVQLKLSVNTVRNHSQNILQKLEVNNRDEAARRARRRGLI